MMAHDLGAAAPPLNQHQPVSWEDPSLYNNRLPPGAAVDTSMNPAAVNAAAWAQGQTSTTPLTTASQIPGNAGLGLVAPAHPLQGAPSYSAGQEGPLWNSQTGRAMALQGAPPDAAHVQYPSQLAPSVAPNYKRPMTTTPAERYPVSMTPPVPGLPSNAPISYDSQSPPVGFTGWGNNPPPRAPGLLPNQAHPGVGANPESSMQGWYPGSQLQYNQMKQQEELALLSSQGQLVDPHMFQQHARKPG